MQFYNQIWGSRFNNKLKKNKVKIYYLIQPLGQELLDLIVSNKLKWIYPDQVAMKKV